MKNSSTTRAVLTIEPLLIAVPKFGNSDPRPSAAKIPKRNQFFFRNTASINVIRVGPPARQCLRAWRSQNVE